MRFRIAACTASLLLSLPVSSAELFYMDHDPVTDEFVGPSGPLVLSGEIIPGDYDTLLSKILNDENRFLAQNKIILASDGGDVGEALKLARLVKALNTTIIVGPLTGRCVSACFFIYAAAGQREADGDRLIGINRPYMVPSEAAAAAAAAGTGAAAAVPAPSPAVFVESDALTQVRAFLQDNAVPIYLVGEMFRRPSDDAYWLSADDLKNLGYKSASFNQYLKAKCAWDDTIEREVYAGKRSVDALKQMLKCRDRVIQDSARQVLAAAAKEKLTRQAGQSRDGVDPKPR